MPGIARAGDTGKTKDDLEDTMDHETPPPPDYQEVDEKTGEFIDCYNEPPKIEVKKVEKSKGKSEEKIFVNGRSVLTAESEFTDTVIKYYERKFELNDKKHLVYSRGKPVYKDILIKTETIDNIKCTGGSSSVFVNGSPIARKGDKLTVGEIDSGSSNVFA